MSQNLRSFLERLGGSKLPGRLDAILQILDLNSESREEFMASVLVARSKSRRDRRQHDFSIFGESLGMAWGLSYLLCRLSSQEREAFREYVSRKALETGASAWIGIAESAGEGFWEVVREPASAFSI